MATFKQALGTETVSKQIEGEEEEVDHRI